MTYKRTETKFTSRGFSISKPADMLGDSEHRYLLNLRQYQLGVLSNRPGMSRINSVALPQLNLHSLVRLNNYLPGASQAFARFVGAGGKLYSDDAAHTTFTERATGFNTHPFQFVTMRPFESPEPWLYITDSVKSGKARTDGTFYNQGIRPPQVAAYAQPAATSYKVIDSMEAVGTWANGGTAGAITAVARIATTISQIVWDTGTTGWATVQPVLQDESLQPGMLLIVNSAGTPETVLVESVADAVTNTTISAIQYDSGSTGACIIQLAAPSNLLARDHMLRINSGGAGDEVVRVLSVTDGPGGLPSLRCSTVNTHAAAETITGVRSFRAFFTLTHATTETLASNNLRSSITVGTGFITLVGALDLSTVNSRPITDEDYIHISIKMDDLSLLTEGRIAFDVDGTTPDFTQNYYWKPFRANDFAPATVGTITALSAQQRVVQRQQIAAAARQTSRNIEGFGGSFGETGADEGSGFFNEFIDEPIDQTTTGVSQWTELKFKVGDLKRVGSDTSRTLHDIAAIRIQLQTTGTVQLDVDAWWIGGSYGPDINIGAPYNYIYVYRSSLTGTLSNPSPPMREGIMVKRQRISGTVTASSDPQVDQIDIYRTGGALIVSDNSPPWFYVMSVPNASPTFIDDQPDDTVIRARQLDFDNYQPFLDRDISRSGTCTVVGTEVTRTGGTDSFSTAWPPGTVIIINNVPYPLYASPSSTTKLSLSESAGNQTGVVWQITAPRLMAQPLPAMWGPFGGGTFEPVIFATGSANQPGHVFWTRPGNADANSQFGALELTSPSESLMNGVVFRSQAYVFSSESLYILTPTVIGGELRFSGAKVAGSRGLFSRYALCIGDEGIFYLSRDGIYLTSGGESISLTDEMLYPLFPHEGAVGITVNTITPPDFSRPQDMRLSYGESELYFDYMDTEGNRRTLLYDIKLKGWFHYRYTPGVIHHYVEEGRGISSMVLGGTDGFLYLSGGTLDGANVVACEVWTPRLDMGDPRGNKQWANGMLDFDASAIEMKVWANNESTLLNTLAFTQSGRGQKVIDFQQVIQRNIQLRITGNAPVSLYGYSTEYVSVSVSELTEQRNAYATQLVFPEYSHCFYLYLAQISTSDITFSVTVDGGTPDTYTIANTNGLFRKDWVMLQARKGLLFDFKFESDEEFQVIPSQTIIKAKSWRGESYLDRNVFGDQT